MVASSLSVPLWKSGCFQMGQVLGAWLLASPSGCFLGRLIGSPVDRGKASPDIRTVRTIGRSPEFGKQPEVLGLFLHGLQWGCQRFSWMCWVSLKKCQILLSTVFAQKKTHVGFTCCLSEGKLTKGTRTKVLCMGRGSLWYKTHCNISK